MALVLRLISINQSFWLDEAIGAIAVKDYSLSEIINQFMLADNHPPFYYLLLKIWSDIFGYSEFSLRFISVIFGVGTVFLTYKIAQQISAKKNNWFPVISALLLATSQIHVYYSQEARMYAMSAFLAALSIYSLLCVIKDSKLINWLLFSLSVTALIFTDYPPLFLYPVFFLYPLISKKNIQWFVKLFLSFVPLIILGILWLPVFVQQSSNGNWLLATVPQWREVAGGANLKQASLVWMKYTLGRITLVDKNLYYLLVVIASIPFVYALFSSFKKLKDNILLWMWFVLPLGIGFLASLYFPAFIYFRFIYVLPAFYLLIARGLSEVKFRSLMIGSLFAVNLTGLLIYYLDIDSLQQRERWKEAVNFIEKNSTQDTVVLFGYPEPVAPYRWYESEKVNVFGVTDSIAPSEIKTRERVEELTKNKEEVYFFEYLTGISNPTSTIRDELSQLGYNLEEKYGQFAGVGFIEHWTNEE